MPSEESILQLKQEIKSWEHGFQRKNNRQPLKSDIKLDPIIYKLYKAYKAIKAQQAKPLYKSSESLSEVSSGLSSNSKGETNSRSVEPTEAAIEIEIMGSVSDNEEIEEIKDQENPFSPTHSIFNAELGPTPQANGKVLSIFDFRLTPPDSSPLKSKSTNMIRKTSSTNNNAENLFKTPTKSRIKRIDFLNINSSTNSPRKNKISQSLQLLANENEIVKTPTKTNGLHDGRDLLETPQYLAKHNRKFIFSLDQHDEKNRNDEILSSPIATGKILTPKVYPITPTKPATLNFSVSPSPLKPHRFLSKRISDIFNDLKNLQEDRSIEENVLEEDAESDDDAVENEYNTLETRVKRKRQTQKRNTRRWKIKPRTNGIEEDQFEGKDIHEEIKKLDKEVHQKLVEYIHSNEEESEAESDSEGEYVKQETTDSKHKRKPISTNYQRLKINDPRTKRFKRFNKR